jgi:hypothetical protein
MSWGLLQSERTVPVPKNDVQCRNMRWIGLRYARLETLCQLSATIARCLEFLKGFQTRFGDGPCRSRATSCAWKLYPRLDCDYVPLVRREF